MKDTQILSGFHDPAAAPTGNATPLSTVLVFDACHVGVVLRAVLFVQSVVAVAAMFGAATPLDWLTRLALLTGATLPATLLWLIVACSLKKVLARLRPALQQVAGVLLGALAGLYGCAMLAMVGSLEAAPWWASAFAGAMLSAALVAALVLRAKAKAPAAATARLAELQARIRPHFLFNTLNSAVALVRAEPRKAERLLEDLSDLFRHALMAHGESVTLAEEIALAQRYLAIEQVRFGERVRIEWALDPTADSARLPPLLLQPLVENAVKHGVEPSASGADIRVSTQRRGSRVVIKVSNTTPASSSAHGHGLALANVRERLSLLHDVQARFQSGLKDGVYQVRIEVPA
ncbi:MAG: sensor histidine kinase [Comamonadaceae bacterium CG_4_9_14_3_um_filter_60_33]|nr:MAG: sensor histidine kinase [Comamonadaceae bacterium CG2_30_59_20]PIY28145.1 MAG: sensor histidine kinase [Comamonadaceae bacterium CG_4_10_14_3_um_filter_60_42]PJB41568.1 MAG: sensor histidine kinase [Comamonadaceae bacterium CG_4_9_14_3_um_filter_60_33]